MALFYIDAEIYSIIERHPEIAHRTLDTIHLGSMLYLHSAIASKLRIGVYDLKLRKLCLQQALTVI